MWFRQGDHARGVDGAKGGDEAPAYATTRPPVRIGDDCVAFVNGRYVEWLVEHGHPVPVWAWLNQAAHGSELDVLNTAIAELPPGIPPPWAGCRRAIAQAVAAVITTTDELATLRRDVLVPLELDLARARLSPPLTPGQLVSLVAVTIDADWLVAA